MPPSDCAKREFLQRMPGSVFFAPPPDSITRGELRESRQFPPELTMFSGDVTFLVAQGDEEAGSYRADLQRALEKGGWHTKGIQYVPEPMQAGLSGLLGWIQRGARCGSIQSSLIMVCPFRRLPCPTVE